jgi:hypothetical protein
MFLCRDGIERPVVKEAITVLITIGGEAREITFTGNADTDSRWNKEDIVCRIGAGAKSHACDARIVRNTDGTFRFMTATNALNRTAQVSGFAVATPQFIKSQHIGSKVI